MSAAKEYAKAIFSLSLDLSSERKVYSDILTCREAISENPDYVRIIDSPALSTAEKLGLIDRAFGSVCECVLNLLKILAQKRRFHLFKDIATEHEALYLEHAGIVRATAVTAFALSGAQKDKIKARLEAITGKQIILENTIDKEVIGGIMLRYAGVQLDSSLRSRLTEIENRLKNTVL